jgi:hypothetical protein
LFNAVLLLPASNEFLEFLLLHFRQRMT